MSTESMHRSMHHSMRHSILESHLTPIVYDSVATIFHFKTFMAFFLKELLCPLSLVFFVFRDGLHFLYGQSFIQETFLKTLFSFLSPLVVILAVISFFLMPAAHHDSIFEILVPLSLFACQKMMVGVKVINLPYLAAYTC